MNMNVRPTRALRAAAKALIGLVLLVNLVACGDTSSTPQGSGTVVLVATATSNEPAPALSEPVRDLLHEAAESEASSILISADSSDPVVVDLAPRRENGEIEYGRRREELIAGRLDAVAAKLGELRASAPGMDAVQGLATAVRASDAGGTIVLLTSGVSTGGALDLRQVGWNANPVAVARAQLDEQLLPDLAQWAVVVSGIGDVAGTQPALDLSHRQRLTDYWLSICQAAGARSCEIDDSLRPQGEPAGTLPVPIVPVQEPSLDEQPDQTTFTLPDEVLGFLPDSAQLATGAQGTLTEVASLITERLEDSEVTVTIAGYTADPPGSTSAGRQALSAARAQSVADALVNSHAIPPATITDVTGGGAAPGASSVINGVFDESRAAQMRRVVIRIQTHSI